MREKYESLSLVVLKDLAKARLELAKAVKTVLKTAMNCILVPFLETM